MVNTEVIRVLEAAEAAEHIKVDPMYENLTEAQCNEIYNALVEAVNSDKPLKQALRESDILGPIIIAGGVAILSVFAIIKNIINTKYRMKVKAIASQSKELTDLFTKVEDLIKHDKMARFKHRNDKVNITTKNIVLKHNNNGKLYNYNNAAYAYNCEYIMNLMEQRINFVNSKGLSKEAKAELMNSISTQLSIDIENEFNNDRWFTRDTTPTVMSNEYKNIRLEDTVRYYKNSVSILYKNNYISNEYVSYESTAIEILEIGYRKMSTKYEKDPIVKKFIDDIFKQLIKNITTVLDFNSVIMNLEEDLFRFYVESIQKLYDYIRS